MIVFSLWAIKTPYYAQVILLKQYNVRATCCCCTNWLENCFLWFCRYVILIICTKIRDMEYIEILWWQSVSSKINNQHIQAIKYPLAMRFLIIYPAMFETSEKKSFPQSILLWHWKSQKFIESHLPQFGYTYITILIVILFIQISKPLI